VAAQISNNSSDGVQISEHASAQLDDVVVTRNGNNGTGNGVLVDDGSSLRLQNASLTGNGGADLSASFGSRLTFDPGNVIGTCNVVDASVLIRGSLPACLG